MPQEDPAPSVFDRDYWVEPRRMLQSGWQLRRIALLLGLLPWAVAVPAQGQTTPLTEYQIKAAFLYNFAKFVEWPAGVFASASSPLRLCVLGQYPFGPDLEQMVEGKKVNGRNIEIVRSSDLHQVKGCQILFVAASERPRVQQILQSLTASSVLTVGDTDGFAGAGGIVNFVVEENRVRFEINVKAAERAHLQLSSRLLMVARVIQ